MAGLLLIDCATFVSSAGSAGKWLVRGQPCSRPGGSAGDREAAMIRRDALREYSRGSLWLLPTGSVVVALLLGVVLSQINLSPGSPLAFQGTADDARNLLIGITSTMVTVIALLLGLAVVALQLSSTQFSPRLLRNFLRDRPNQIVLSVFVGTFAYAAGGLFDVGGVRRGAGRRGGSPRVSVASRCSRASTSPSRPARSSA